MEIVTTIAPVCLAIIMFGLGLGLTIGDFTRVLKNPRDFLVGFLCQVILLPIIAFILISIISLPPEIALGVTAIVSLLSIFIVPLIVFNSADFLGIETAKDISMLNIAMKMFLVVTVPVVFGMIVRSLMTNFIISKTLIIQRLSVILFLVVFIAIWVEEWDRIVSYITRAGLIAFILNITMIFVGYYVAKFWTSGIAQRKCISLECGLQNGTLAVFVTTQLFDDIVFMVPTAAYALVMFCTSIIFVLIVRKIN
jgi:BASS family bile acid:Na+ symporter